MRWLVHRAGYNVLLFVSWITDRNLHIVSSFIAPYSLTSSNSVWWCYPVLCVIFCTALLDSTVLQKPELLEILFFGGFIFVFFNLWGCGPVVFVVLTFANQAKFREMLFLPALQCSHVRAVAVTLTRFKPVLLQGMWKSSSHVNKC